MLGSREHSNQPAKTHLEAGLGVRWGDFRNRRLLADHELQLRNEVNEQRAVRVQRLTQLLPPFDELDLWLPEKLTNQPLEGLGQCAVRHFALKLIELADGEQASWWDQYFVQLAYQRG